MTATDPITRVTSSAARPAASRPRPPALAKPVIVDLLSSNVGNPRCR